MGDKYDLLEYGFARDVVKDFPKIEKELDYLYKTLYKYQDYLAVANVLDAIGSSKEMIHMQYSYYKKVLEKKGKE